MRDMIVRLLELPDAQDALSALEDRGTAIRRALPADRSLVNAWASEHFGGWSAEIDMTFDQTPISCFLAVNEGLIVGFAAYDGLFKNLFGPTGVVPEKRGTGIGRALLFAVLHAQRDQGYAYSIIGGVGPAEYYAKVVGARLIDGPAAVLAAKRPTSPLAV